MLGKIPALLSSKVAIAAMGGLLLVGGATTAAFAATGQAPVAMALLSSAHGHHSDSKGNSQGNNKGKGKGSQDDNGTHADTVAIQGTLMAYTTTNSPHAIQVTGKAEDNDDNKGHKSGSTTTSTCSLTSPFTIALDGNTKINGQAKIESDLSKYIGNKVEVQATEDSSCRLLATKVTVSNAKPGAKSHTYVGTVVGTVGTSSFTLQPKHGSAITVNITPTTTFGGNLHSLADLTTGMHVIVHGTMPSSGTVQASSIAAHGHGHPH